MFEKKELNMPRSFCFCFGSVYYKVGRRGGLMVSVLDSGASGLSSSPGRGHCVLVYTHSVILVF